MINIIGKTPLSFNEMDFEMFIKEIPIFPSGICGNNTFLPGSQNNANFIKKFG
ncbi:hypothetical protein MgSA37_03951 [Mucilaginibacter gotjawali]|uniref:Uncharacterized protein n=2 Tax=Mucilaginibacter gotjawali TaxID=1550579 RepID=A0A0X8X500_9SPHI|nr:hypothetical protein [Mucilaginibacter gotjawali]BAU55759.1 hypothetical protein MgSA37_03951 [Mucilaginibacter gotjawali]